MSLLKRLSNVTGTPHVVTPKSPEVQEAAPVVCASPPGLAPPPGLDMVEELSQKSSTADEGHSLRTDLEKVKLYQPGCALLVRKIKPLGFESAEHLKTHFEKMG